MNEEGEVMASPCNETLLRPNHQTFLILTFVREIGNQSTQTRYSSLFFELVKAYIVPS